jgi:hypothetical protein
VQAKRSWVAVAVGFIGLAIPVSASGATQIGETFSPSPGGCSNDRTYLQTGSPGSSYAAPSAGVITSWSFQTGASPPQLKLKVGRSAGGNSFTIVGESELQAPPPHTPNTYPAQIPVESGDMIGFYLATPAGAGCADGGAAGSGYTYHLTFGDVAPGTTMAYFPGGSPAKLDISASLEADCDEDGFGDETQDPSISSCHPRALTLDANKNKVKKGKKVTLSGRVSEFVRQGECQSAQPVQLQRKKPSQSTFTTIEQLQTDAAGSFSTRKKVKKTFQYRAQVSENATCGGGVSNTEKVKVKKKR